MSFLGGGGKSVSSTPPTAAGALAIQTSVQGRSITLAYGRNRLSPNLFWYNDFVATPVAAASPGGSGKGFGGGQTPQTSSYTYTTAIMMSLCEGPIDSVGTVWKDKDITTLSALAFSLFTGSYSQAVWTYLSTYHPDQALAYIGTAFVAAGPYQLGDSPNLGNHSFEVQALLGYNVGAGIYDADPKAVFYDYLTDARHGLGVSTSLIADWTQFSNYCVANSFLISPIFDSQSAAAQQMMDVLNTLNVAVFESSGLLHIVPLGDTTLTGNGVTYTPNLTPLFDLTDDDFIVSGAEEPVISTRSSPADAYNQLDFECVDRSNNYNVAAVEAKDQNAIELYGLRPASGATAHWITSPTVGQTLAQLMVQRMVYVRNQYKFKLGWKYCVLEPCDLVTITDSSLGLSRQLVRVLTTDEDDNGNITITAERVDVGVAAAPVYGTQAGLGYVPNYQSAPGSISVPILFEPPVELVTSAGGFELWAGLSGVNPLWGGCTVWASSSASGQFKMMGQQHGSARMGITTAALPTVSASPTGQTIDTVNTLAVNVSMSVATLLSGTQLDALNLNTLCYVGGELLSYQTSTLTGTNKYTLSYLVRGVYDDGPYAVASGAQFLRLDDAVFTMPFTPDQIGQTIYLKFTSFNSWGLAEQSLADVPSYAYTFTGAAYLSPLPNVTGFSSGYVADITTLSWNSVTDFRSPDYEIRQGGTWSSGAVIGRFPTLQAPTNGDGTYWIAAHFTVPNGPDIYSPTPVSIVISGSQLTSNVIASYDEAATGWLGTFTDTQILGGYLTLKPSGDILTDPDIIITPDIIWYGGATLSGIYQIPTAHQIGIGYVAPCQVIVNVTKVLGLQLNAADIITSPDVIIINDVLGLDLGNSTYVVPQIRMSQDGTTFGAWQNWIPGVYPAQKYDCRLLLYTSDPQVIPRVPDIVFAVDVPDRIDHYTVAAAAGGSAITFQPDGAASSAPFNGGTNGQALPHPGFAILGGASGDTLLITAFTLSGCTVQVQNGGVGVSGRTVKLTMQGY